MFVFTAWYFLYKRTTFYPHEVNSLYDNYTTKRLAKKVFWLVLVDRIHRELYNLLLWALISCAFLLLRALISCAFLLLWALISCAFQATVQFRAVLSPQVPLLLEDINNDEHPVEVGVSDAFYVYDRVSDGKIQYFTNHMFMVLSETHFLGYVRMRTSHQQLITTYCSPAPCV